MRLNLGCGSYIPKGDDWVHIDWSPLSSATMRHDLNKGIPYPDSSVDEILARNILMHLEDPIFILSECWRVLKPNGLLEIHTPLVDLNLSAAFRDPTMKHFWSSDTLEHFLPGGWDAHYMGFVGQFVRAATYREDGELRYEIWRALK